MYAQSADEFIKGKKYGSYQLDKEINIKVGSGTYNKKGEEVLVPKYKKLDECISVFKKELKLYYDEVLKSKLFEYELLKQILSI